MRGIKSLLAMAVVLGGLGAYIYFVTLKQDDSGGSKQEKVFAGLAADQIGEITVKPEKGDAATVKKTDGVWQVVTPAPGKAAETEVTGVASALASLEVVRVLEENPASLKDYGLDAPRITVEYKSADGKSSGTLLIGGKTTAGSNMYVKRGDQPRVLVVAGFNEASLNKSAFDLRDKSIMTIDRTAVTSIDVTANGGVIQLDRVSGVPGTDPTWKLVRPIASRADNSSAEGILSRIENTQMKSIASNDASPADLKTYGLDKPAATVVMKLGSAQATLAIGGKAGADDVYVRDVSKPIVMTVEKGFLDDLTKKAEDYRLKDVFEFKAFTVTHIELTHDGKTVTFDREKGKDNAADVWKRVSPTAGEPDKEKMSNLLTGLADIRADSFVASRANTGLDSPALTIVAKYDEGKKEERVTIGRSGKDAYAATVDPGIAKFDAGRLDEALKALDEVAK